ncbi:NAD(+) diphosphatase [Novosphingobium sp. KACC 22771]|uniref:NAD(+) diphosphatase n=1 Tax=Novosphingobium sp. KACC 22771 TaxID=3025670 RepID=UPI003FCF1E9A
MRPPITFTGSALDRADAVRSDPERLAALWARGGRLLRMDGLEPSLEDGALVWSELAGAPEGEAVFLGLDGAGIGHFAPVPSPDAASTAPASFNLWQALGGMDHGEIAIYGAARALVGWHARHRFCARCGGATVLAKGGWQRDCTVCATPHFPRTDPVVIMSVEHEGRLLLGRQPRFPPHRYSALAGFIEPGESIEEAVAREIYEEAGVKVRDVRYVASQPWPFPSSLMIAAHAFADDPALTIDHSELEDARWFTREEVVEAMAARERGEDGAAFSAPSRTAVAWHLLADWLED